MTRTARLLLVWALLWIPIGLFAYGRWARSPDPQVSASDLPAVLAGHTAFRDETLDARVLEILTPGSYVLRTYRHGDSAPLSIYVAAYSGRESGTAHDPSVCYPSQGWDLLHLRSVEVPLPGHEQLSAKLLSASQSGEQQLALYWFQPLGRWPEREPLEEWLRVLDRVRGRRGHAFVRIALVDSGEPDFAQSALPVLIEVARELAPWVRAALEGSPPAQAAAAQAAAAQIGRGEADRFER